MKARTRSTLLSGAAILCFFLFACQRKAASPEIIARDFITDWMARVQRGENPKIEWYQLPFSTLDRWELTEIQRPDGEDENCIVLSLKVWKTPDAPVQFLTVKLYLQDGKTRLLYAVVGSEAEIAREKFKTIKIQDGESLPFDFSEEPWTIERPDSASFTDQDLQSLRSSTSSIDFQ